MAPSRSKQGFTLIEVLVAVGVIALSTGFVVVSLGGVTLTERLRAGTRKLAGMSDFVRSQAAGSKSTCTLEIDFDHNRYRFLIDPASDAAGRPWDPETEELLAPEDVAAWYASFEWESLPHDIYFGQLMYNRTHFYAKGIHGVQYRPDGSVSTYHLTIKAKEDSREHAFTIVVNGLSGQAEVMSGVHLPKEAFDADFAQVIGNAIGEDK